MGFVNGQDGNIRGAELNSKLSEFGGFSFATGGKLDMSQVFAAAPAANPTLAPGAPSYRPA